MCPTPYSSLLRYFSIICLSIGFQWFATADDGTIALWEFNESVGQGLTKLSNTGGKAAFDEGILGVGTDGKGRLAIRQSLGIEAIRNVPFEPIISGKVWLQVDIAGWDLYGEATEELSFGFSGEEGLEEAVALLEWKRLAATTVWMTGRADGLGASAAAVDEFLSARHPKPVSYVLECDLDQYVYEIYKSEEKGQWKSIGRGAIAEGVEIHHFRFGVKNRFQDDAKEYFHIDQIRVTREDPIDRSKWEAISEYPYITAWAWGVADARTGEILAGENVDVPRTSASITKAMTTYVVCEMAKEDPSILDEMVHFSELALQVNGSSAEIEVGESLPLREALYALMLPSGNAVGNAIAEHFHDRLPPVKESEEVDPRARFIAKMNETAKALGMKSTAYRSPFGDGGGRTHRTTTVRDLFKLGAAAMENELFRKVVGTKEYSTEITMADGSKRIGEWTNTNEFLGLPGFNGIKTGTTTTARACLLSSVEIEGRSYYGVVLGSNHGSRRYVDSRNMFDWVAKNK